MFVSSFRGGARIGWVNASWPFAKLTAYPQSLTLSSLGTYTFAPSEVVALERYGSLPILSYGIRIVHNRLDYPSKVIFWCVGRRGPILEEIARIGFRPTGHPLERPRGFLPRWSRFPLRWSAIFIAFALWNGLFLFDRAEAGHRSSPGAFSLLALLLLLGSATATQVSPQFQRLVLRPGHQVGEVKAYLVLIQIVASILVAGFAITWIATR